MRGAARRVRWLALLGLAGGCSSDFLAIKGSDQPLVIPIAGATWKIFEPRKPDATAGTLALEMETWSVRGHDERELPAGTFGEFGGETFHGPANLDVDWRVIDVAVDARGGLHFPWGGTLEALLGFEGERVDVHVEEEAEHYFEIGPVYGLQGAYEVVDDWSLLARWQEYFAIFGGGGDRVGKTKVEHVRVGLECDALPHVELFGGWMWWLYLRHMSESDVRLRVSAPAIAIRFRF